ncbi:hypothetical protein A3A49_01375 [Candidatus Curtissbacteria bacterium RIFCSPLOWO2_01_FULL_38_11b]|uniref:Uncharacterized protein n=1 Tax=Candidatus Curtissbacteria bacterium RIFCSPLOWO2_01_FULL_38_11b TaxID=1797725 RepID=A0A1F5H2L8_9BACT|nr:MAG: hypothetical protein A3A49_01375 [Candidatus Curtissbacteria bacterium RIFCSPLOWO2_01_FULL_38_11b]
MPNKSLKKNITDNIKGFSIISKLSFVPNALAVIFYIIWIVVGIAMFLIIYGNFKQGAFRGLLSKPQPPPQQAQAPTETTLPGIGKVNVACVQSALTTEAIQKILADGNTSKLTKEEKAKFEPCIVEAETANPQASP